MSCKSHRESCCSSPPPTYLPACLTNSMCLFRIFSRLLNAHRGNMMPTRVLANRRALFEGDNNRARIQYNPKFICYAVLSVKDLPVDSRVHVHVLTTAIPHTCISDIRKPPLSSTRTRGQCHEPTLIHETSLTVLFVRGNKTADEDNKYIAAKVVNKVHTMPRARISPSQFLQAVGQQE